MNVLLINPPWTIESKKNIWKKIGSCLPSVGLGYIASSLEQAGHDVTIIDSVAEGLCVNNFINIIKDIQKHEYVIDYIGITATTALINNTYLLCDMFKKELPNTKIVLGGVHPSIMPEEAIQHCDFVIIGEGEETMIELVNGNRLDNIKGLVYKIEAGVRFNSSREQLNNLDDLPMPSYHLLPMKSYYPAIGSYKRLPAMSIISSRNCSNNCTYCFHLHKRVTFRSAQNIIKEIELLVYEYGIKEIQFYDDNFLLYKQNVINFCELLDVYGLKITWSCFSRIDAITKKGIVDIEYLKILKKSGCHLILFGVETADETIMKNINKHLNLNDVKPTIDVCRMIGIETRCSYMFGNIGETEESCKKTIDFSLYVDSDFAQFNIATAFPGTEMYKWANENKYLLHEGWNDFNMSDKVIELPTISNKKLDYYYALAHKKFYMRPKIIIRRLLKIRTLTQLIQEIKGGLAILK